MTECITQYKKALKKNLRCSGSVQERLMAKFDATLTAFLEDTPDPGKDEVYAAFGPPKEMAELLMTEVTPEEAALYRRRNTFLRATAGILAGVFLAGAIYIYFFKEQDVSYNNDIAVDGVFAVEASFVGDGPESVE